MATQVAVRTRPIRLAGFLAAVLLAGCSDSDSGVQVSGQLRAEIATAVDSDINDIRADFISNNDCQAPQQLNSSLLTLQGYVTNQDNNGSRDDARFSDSRDPVDYYQVRLQQNQSVEIRVASRDSDAAIAASFVELDDNGQEKNDGQNVVVDSTRFGADFISAASADYLIGIHALGSGARYTLRLLTQSNNTANQATPDFVAGELLVKYKPADSVTDSVTGPAADSTTDNRRAAFSLNTTTSDYPTRITLNLSQPGSVRALSSVASDRSALASSQTSEPTTSNVHLCSASADARLQTLQQAHQLRQQSNVEYVQPNYIYQMLQTTPNDSYFSWQWPLQQIQAPLAWDQTTGSGVGGNQVIIAVLDSGILVQHPDLEGQLVPGYDFVSRVMSGDGDGPDNDPTDPGRPGVEDYPFHGTHVAGIAAAASNNGKGIAGVSWGAKIMPLRVLGNTGSGTSDSVIQGMRYAAGLSNVSGTLPAQAADILNLSLGSTFDASVAPAEQALINELYELGIPVVAAAGNSGVETPFYPAAYDKVISVSATNLIDQLAYYSNFGRTISVAAPGGTVFRDDNNDGRAGDQIWSLGAEQTEPLNYALSAKQGTSMAAPHVAGVIALMKAVYPPLTAAHVDNLMKNGRLTDDIGPSNRDNQFGYGRINALKAVNEALRLANGGELPPLPSQLVSQPATLALGTIREAEITVQNLGGGSPQLAVATSADWLNVNPITSLDTSLNGDVTVRLGVTINPTNLNVGFYQGTVRVTARDGNPAAIDIPVYIQVGQFASSGELTQQYVSLFAEGSDSPSKTVVADSSGRYVFNDVSPGRYQVIAGSDIDANNVLGESAETYGKYPLSPGLPLLQVDADNVRDINFSVSVLELNTLSTTANGQLFSRAP